MVNREQRTLMGAYIRQQRKLADMSMRQVSAMVGISNPYLSQIERGLRVPSEAVAASLATALGISVDEFKDRYGSRNEHSALLDAIDDATELTPAQRASLTEIYRSFVRTNTQDGSVSDGGADEDASDAEAGDTSA